jgi:hypothetical protein
MATPGTTRDIQPIIAVDVVVHCRWQSSTAVRRKGRIAHRASRVPPSRGQMSA